VTSNVIITLLLYIAIITIIYTVIGWSKIFVCLRMFFSRTYWVNYNVIEFLAWFTKALIIIPGLIFGIEIWQLHIGTLVTSTLLIWASMRKLLPTLLLFNTLWVGISTVIIVRNII
jgi:hypothetical protein